VALYGYQQKNPPLFAVGFHLRLDSFDLETIRPPRGAYPYDYQADPDRPQQYIHGARNGCDGTNVLHT
jgi:hypothetical protein